MQNISWHSDSMPEPSETMTEWLVHPGSFMQRLREHGMQAEVQVLFQGWQLPTEDGRQVLGVPFRRNVYVREVIIRNEQTDWMYARTTFPLETLTGQEKRFMRLRNRSLGSILFNDPCVTRGEFDFAHLQAGLLTYDKIVSQAKVKAKEIWGRRSIFYIKEKPLLLEEYFLPAIEKLNM